MLQFIALGCHIYIPTFILNLHILQANLQFICIASEKKHGNTIFMNKTRVSYSHVMSSVRLSRYVYHVHLSLAC